MSMTSGPTAPGLCASVSNLGEREKVVVHFGGWGKGRWAPILLKNLMRRSVLTWSGQKQSFVVSFGPVQLTSFLKKNDSACT